MTETIVFFDALTMVPALLATYVDLDFTHFHCTRSPYFGPTRDPHPCYRSAQLGTTLVCMVNHRGGEGVHVSEMLFS